MRIALLPRKEAVCRLAELLELDREIPAEPWDERAFLLELPQKFHYSRLLLDGERAVGFLVASRAGNSVHVHRLVISKSARGKGHGRRLIESVAAAAESDGLGAMTLKVAVANVAAVEFYREIGFREAGSRVGGKWQLVADLNDLAPLGPSGRKEREGETGVVDKK